MVDDDDDDDDDSFVVDIRLVPHRRVDVEIVEIVEIVVVPTRIVRRPSPPTTAVIHSSNHQIISASHQSPVGRRATTADRLPRSREYRTLIHGPGPGSHAL
jgi:hypothetical protein